MSNIYWIQVNDWMSPVKVMLDEKEVNAVVKTLKAIAEGDKDSLVEICDEDSNSLYTNWSEWIKTHK